MAYNQKRSMIAGTDPVKKAKEKADSHASSEPSIEEQLKLRNNNKKLRDQCNASGGTWNLKKGVCEKKEQDSKYSDLEKYDDDRG